MNGEYGYPVPNKGMKAQQEVERAIESVCRLKKLEAEPPQVETKRPVEQTSADQCKNMYQLADWIDERLAELRKGEK